MTICLTIAGYTCHLIVNDRRWHTFLTSKYADFLAVPSKQPHMICTVQLGKANRYHLVERSTSNHPLICTLQFPNTLRQFKRFNMYLKSWFSRFLLEQEGVVVHASAVMYKKKGYIFVGKRGAGKSTIARLLRDVTVISDDASIIRRINGTLYLSGSPFYEKNATVHTTAMFPLERVFLLEKSSANRITPVPENQKMTLVGSVVAFPMIYSYLLEKPFEPALSKKIIQRAFFYTEELYTRSLVSVLAFTKEKPLHLQDLMVESVL